MSGNIVFWLEGTEVKNGVLLDWVWLPCECSAAKVLTPYGQTIEVLAEDIFLSRGLPTCGRSRKIST